MDFETIKFELRDDGIGILTLNRPDKLNAMNFQMIEDLHQVFDNLMINLDCRVLILKAEGRAFCAGLDLRESTVLQSKKKPEELKQKFFYARAPDKDIIKAKMYGQWRTSHLIPKMHCRFHDQRYMVQIVLPNLDHPCGVLQAEKFQLGNQ